MEIKKEYDFVVSGYTGANYILKVHSMPKVGVTELVTNYDNSVCYCGGNGINIAFYLSRLGMNTLPIIRGGSDFEDLGFLNFLKFNGISTEALSKVENDISSACYLIQDKDNNHLTLFYTGAMDNRYAPESYPDEYFTSSRYALMSVASPRDNWALLKGARKHTLPLIFAMRADPSAFPDNLLNEVLHEAILIFMNEVERDYIKAKLGYDPVTELFHNGKADAVIVTLGDQGCHIYEKGNSDPVRKHIRVTKGKRVEDATGAGDSFIAGFLYGYTKGEEFKTCAEYGSTMASFIIEKVGCLTNVPDEEQMLSRNALRGKEE